MKTKKILAEVRDTCRYYGYEATRAIVPYITEAGIRLIMHVNPHKDNSLSYRLHHIADQYDTRPKGHWHYDV